VTVATSSTSYGADLLVAGTTPAGEEVRKLALGRPSPEAKNIEPKLVSTLPVLPGVAGAAPLAGR
jgi:hypothetical protein